METFLKVLLIVLSLQLTILLGLVCFFLYDLIRWRITK